MDVLGVAMGGITIIQQNSAVSSFFQLKILPDKKEETLLEGFCIAKRNVCSKLVLVNR